MSFYKKYELIDVLHDDGVKTFQAKEIESGRAVEVHLFVGVPGKSDPPYTVLEAIRTIPPDRRSQLVEIGEHMGTAYVVTLPLSGFSNLRDWVQANKGEAAAQPETLARVGRWKIPPSMRESGATEAPAQPVTKRQSIPQPDTPDITRMFKTAEIVVPPREQPNPWATGQMATPQPAPTPAPVSHDDFDILFGSTINPTASKATQPQQSAQPADFTQMFQTGGHLKVPDAPVAPPTPPPAQTVKPGEFTGLFTAPASGPTPAPPAAKADEHDDFNRMFDTATGRIKPSGLPKTAPAKPVEPPKSSGPGEFTQMFQAPASAPPPPVAPAKLDPPKTRQASQPAPPPPTGPGEFTQMFQASTGQIKPPDFTKTAQGPAFTTPPPEATKPDTPGDFTQMFQTGSVKTPDFSRTAQGPAFTPPAEPAKPAAPGEFTQMFHAPTGQAKVPDVPKTAPAQAFPPPPESPKPAAGPGEFTQMFHAPTGQTKPAGSQPFGQTSGFPAQTPSAPAAPASPTAPGEFTQMFQTAPHQPFGESPSTSKPITQRGTPPGVVPPPPAPQGPGEFTRMFASPSQPMGESPMPSAVPPGPSSSAPPREPGEFTRMFSQPGVGSLPKQQLPIATPQQSPLSQPNPFAPPTSPLSQPMLPPNPGTSFGAPSAGQPSSPFGQTPPPPPGIGAIPNRPYAAPAQPSVQDEYAKLFGGGGPAAGTPGGFSAPPPPAQQPQQFHGGGLPSITNAFKAPQVPMPQGQPAGPSEYTRMFTAPKEMQAAAPPPVQAPIPLAAAKKTPKWPLFVAGGLFLLLLIGLAVTLLRK